MGRARYGVPNEIRDTVDAFYRALSTRNLKSVDNMWAHVPYASVAGPVGDMYQGWEQVRRFWEQRFQQLTSTTMTVRLSGIVSHAVGDVAWLSGTEHRKFNQDGNSRDEALRVTCVFERSGTHWQLVSYHASLAAESPLALTAAS